MEIKEVKLWDNHKATIKYADDCIDPREDSCLWLLTFRPNRSYKLPEEIEFDFLWFDDWDEDAVKRLEEIEKDYYVFRVDCYIHSWYAFSLSWEWMQCPRDTAKNAWLIAIPKEYATYNWKLWKWNEYQNKSEKIVLSREEALKIARSEIRERDDYFNGNQYEAIIYVERTYKCIETWEITKDREYEEWTWVFYSVEDLEDYLKSEYNDWKDLEEI